MRGLAFLLAAASAFAAVDGTVTNGTRDTPQASITVTLFKLGQAGPEFVATTKTDAQGKFRFEQAPASQGPLLVETVWQGVTYNRMLPPGMPTEGVPFEIFDSARKPGIAKLSQHIVMLEPANGRLSVGEMFLVENGTKLTYHNPQDGTLRFWVPPDGKSSLRVMATAPGGMPLQREPGDTSQPDTYMLNFPIKPGETRIDVGYSLPLGDPATFSGRSLYKEAPTRLVVPNGVTLEGDGIKSLGSEPNTQAAIYETRTPAYQVKIQGTGSLRAASAEESGDDNGPTISEILPRVYQRVVIVVGATLAALALGFVLLYRKRA